MLESGTLIKVTDQSGDNIVYGKVIAERLGTKLAGYTIVYKVVCEDGTILNATESESAEYENPY